MNTSRLVDPELRPLLDVFPSFSLTHDNLNEVRSLNPLAPQSDDRGVVLQQRKAPGPAGAPEISLHIYRPAEITDALPCIYHIHGGGFVSGSAEISEPVHRELSANLGCAIISVNYRLAPETAFPGNLEDCYAGLAWTMRHADELGLDARRVGVMGESAGGGLAAALALLARDRGEFRLSFQHLTYPMLDDRTCVTPEPHPFAGEFVWPAHNNRFGWEALLGGPPGGPNVSAYAAPARATDLSRLPAAFISTGALDLFVEEDLDYARRLIRAGVPVELHVFPGAFHGFDIAPQAKVSIAARRIGAEALRRALSRSRDED